MKTSGKCQRVCVGSLAAAISQWQEAVAQHTLLCSLLPVMKCILWVCVNMFVYVYGALLWLHIHFCWSDSQEEPRPLELQAVGQAPTFPRRHLV